MAILKVAQLGHPVLRTVARPVGSEWMASPEFPRLMADMLDTLQAYRGAGLAAPQVHVSLRLVVLTLAQERGPEFWINPVITSLSKTTSPMVEGCLSVEGLRGQVERPDHIQVDFTNPTGQRITYELAGFPAVVAQHECDHLDGVLFIDKALPKTLAFVTEYHQFGLLNANGQPTDDAPPMPPDRIVDRSA